MASDKIQGLKRAVSRPGLCALLCLLACSSPALAEEEAAEAEPDSAPVSAAPEVSVDAATVTPRAADELAQNGQYAAATQAYEAILQRGQEGASIYYNLGYSYFKQGMLGRAILNFERARRLDPGDEDVRENLRQAYSLTDKMLVVEPNVLEQAWRGVRDALSSDGWAWLFVCLFALSMGGLACFLFLSSVGGRKAGFFGGIVCAVLAVASLTLSLQKRAETLRSAEAIIMSSSVNLSTSPDKNGGQMAVLHEGTHVQIVDELGEWIEVKLDDGNVGWLKAGEVERI